MRFTLVKDLRSDALMRPMLTGLLLFTALFLVADIFLTRDHIGLSVTALSVTLYGNEETFIEPVTEHFVLELVHGNIFFMMMVLLTLSAVYARLCTQPKLRLIMINIAMAAALFDICLLPLAYYLGEAYLLPWLAAFWIWHLCALAMALLSLLRLYLPRK